MPIFKVTITEHRATDIYVEADYDFEALHKVEEQYQNHEINLDNDDELVNFKMDCEEVIE